MLEQPNVLLITIDSLRADHLGCYGYPRATSPRMDALAAEGALAEWMLCPGIPTHPSYTTLYTGQHPLRHGIWGHGGQLQLADEAPLLAQILAEAGYTTCAVDNLARNHSWFGQGYEFYINPTARANALSIGVTCEEINSRAIPWLRHHQDEQFFLFLHYWDPHWPYKPPARYRSLFYEGRPVDPANHSLDEWFTHPLGMMAHDSWLRTPQGVVTDAAYVTALYDQETRYLDDGIAALLGTLDDLGLTENTLVILMADHGESMTEHGIFYEAHGLYDPTIHIPFIARWPGHLPAGRRVAPMVQVLDIAPTILDAAGLPVPEEMDGRSCWGLLTGDEKSGGYERVVSMECSWQAKWSMRTDRHKLILARQLDRPDLYGKPPIELYDLVADPGEDHNLADEQPELTARLVAELEGWIAERLQEVGRERDPLLDGSSVFSGYPLNVW